MLPTFILIGAMRSGTTSLTSYLRAHPEAFVTTPKEPDFFGANWERGVQWYEALFAGAGSVTARGEASTHYTMAPHVPDVPERMASLVPDVRLVYLIRNPVERIHSMYLHYRARGSERRSIDEAVRRDPRYLDVSRYACQLEGYLERFRREQILIVSSERLRADRRHELARVFGFVGVDPTLVPHNVDRERHRGSEQRRVWGPVQPPLRALRRMRVLSRVPSGAKRPLRRLMSRPVAVQTSSELDEWLWQELRPDLARLRAIVGAEFDLWGRA